MARECRRSAPGATKGCILRAMVAMVYWLVVANSGQVMLLRIKVSTTVSVASWNSLTLKVGPAVKKTAPQARRLPQGEQRRDVCRRGTSGGAKRVLTWSVETSRGCPATAGVMRFS